MPMTAAVRACLFSLAVLALAACAVPSKISAPEGAVNFGQVLVPLRATQPLSMTTWGSEPVTVAQVRASGGDLKQFVLTAPGSGYPLSVDPPDPLRVPVTFAPKAKGYFEAEITAEVTGGQPQNFPARAIGEGVFDIRKGFVSMDVVGADGLNFGEPFIGVATELPISFVNRSDEAQTFSITKPAQDSAFRTNIEGSRVTIPAGGRVTYRVLFRPVSEEEQLHVIILKADDENFAGITLRGKGRRRG